MKHDIYDIIEVLSESTTESIENEYPELFTESVIFSKKDLYKNFDKFENGESNILLVTGLTGSGKSTIARQICSKHHAEYIELDVADPFTLVKILDLKDPKGIEKLKKYGDVFYDFFKSHNNYYKDLEKLTNDSNASADMMDEFLEYCFTWCKNHKNKKFVIEGIQIYEYYRYNHKPVYYPIIIKNTSVLHSFIRKIKREKWTFKEFMKKAPETIKWMFNSESQLNALIKEVDY